MTAIEIARTIEASGLRLLTLREFKRLLDIAEENTAYKTAERLVKQGLLRRLKKGLYCFAFAKPSTLEIANALYAPSYVSLESALNFYGILSQFPYPITSVTPRKTERIEADGKEFEYVHLAPKYFFGFTKIEAVLIAQPEKALVDELYMVSKGIREVVIEELDLSRLDKGRLQAYVQQIPYSPLQALWQRIDL